MNKLLVHFKDDKNSIIKFYVISLCLVFIYGFYKNFIGLIDSEVNLRYGVAVIIMPLISFIAGIITDSILNKKLTLGYKTIEFLIFSMVMPPLIPLWVYSLGIGLLVLLSLVDKNDRFNKITFAKIAIILILVFMNKYLYFNILETTNEYKYSLVDMFVGNSVGGAFSTSILLILVSYIILSFNKLYKQEIPLISITTYCLVILFTLIFKNYTYSFQTLLNSSALFAFVFIAPINYYSPVNFKEKVIYSVFIGLIGAILAYFGLTHDSVILAICFYNFISFIIHLFHKSTN